MTRYTVELTERYGLANGIVFADGREIGRAELAVRDSVLEQAREIVEMHADGQLTVASVELSTPPRA